MNSRLSAGLLFLALFPAPALSQSTAAEGVLGFYRYPALHGDRIVFAAEGDLWRVPIDEFSGETRGAPEPVTTGIARIMQADFAGDGKRLAVTAQRSSMSFCRFSASKIWMGSGLSGRVPRPWK